MSLNIEKKIAVIKNYALFEPHIPTEETTGPTILKFDVNMSWMIIEGVTDLLF